MEVLSAPAVIASDDDDEAPMIVERNEEEEPDLPPPIRTMVDANNETWVSWYQHGPLFREKYIHLIPHYVYPDSSEYRTIRSSLPLLAQCDIYMLMAQEDNLIECTDMARIIDHPAMRIYINILDQSPLMQSYTSNCLCTTSGYILISCVGSRLEKYQQLCTTFPQLSPVLNIIQLAYLIGNEHEAVICRAVDRHHKKIRRQTTL